MLVIKRTAKYLFIRWLDGETQWISRREGESSEYVKFPNGATYDAADIVDGAHPDEFSIKKGDRVYTPRFMNVRIEKVFKSEENARRQGYTEPTHYKNGKYGVFGKVIGTNRSVFAAFVKSVK